MTIAEQSRAFRELPYSAAPPRTHEDPFVDLCIEAHLDTTASFSSRALRCFGTGTILASTICLPRDVALLRRLIAKKRHSKTDIAAALVWVLLVAAD